ncbi:MAG: helix-turn-helix transcriptional regulator [Candidatus Aminicenantes bacterium]|jgi:AraC-like DNA-binding protein
MTKTNHLSEKVIKYILSRSNEELGELTVERIAYALKVSQSHLYDIFKSEKKITPGRFLIMMKMYRSAFLLEEEKKIPIKKISRKMGFSSSDYFNKIFREYFGTTPGRYRGYVRTKGMSR